MHTLTEMVEWRAGLNPDVMALIDDGGHRLTYAELASEIDKRALAWSAHGVRPGDVVAVVERNSTAYLLELFSLTRLRAVPAVLNWRLTTPEISAIFSLIEPVAVAAGSDLVPTLPSELPELRVAFGASTPTGWMAADDLIGSMPNDGPRAINNIEPPNPDDPFVLAFSSGTTGLPKAIPMRHRSLVRSSLVDSLGVEGMYVGAPHLAPAPLFHLAGLVNVLMGMTHGASVHVRAVFSPDDMLDTVEREHIVYTTVVPAMFLALVRAAEQREIVPDLSSLVEITYGASPVAPELLREVFGLVPQCRIRQFYGMTEIAGALTTLQPTEHVAGADHLGSAGRVNLGFEVRLVDPDGSPVPEGFPGEIHVRGETVMTGYWNDPDATAAAMSDGWFATGDIARNDDGFFTILDRAKDMIVSGGENVFPAEVEAVLYEHPAIGDVAVIGVPDDRFGERVHAVIVAAGNSDPSLDEVQAWARDRLAGYKLPRSLEVMPVLPRNATGKILKRELRAPHWADQDRSV